MRRLHRDHLFLDDAEEFFARAQDFEVFGDLGGQPVQGFGDFVTAERSQALQAQFENGARLGLRQAAIAVLVDAVARVGDQRDQGRHVMRRPEPAHQRLAGRGRIGGGADQPDDLVDIGDGDRQADLDMSAVARLVEQELGAAADDLLAEIDESPQAVQQVQAFGPSAVQRDHVDAEGALQRREAVELVEHDLRHGVATDLDDDAHAFAVGFVAQVGNALDLLLAHEFGDLLDQRRLVHLIGNFGEDDGFAILADRLDRRKTAHQHRTAAGLVGLADSSAAEDRAAGGEIRPRHDLHDFRERYLRIVDQGDAGVDDFAEVMRRDIGRHAHGDAARAIDQQVGEARRQDGRLPLLAVVVGIEVDRIGIDVLDQRQRRPRQARFRVAHGRGAVAVDRAEIPLPVDQRQAHREGLRHAHQGVIDRRVAMGMVFTHDLADDARRLHIGAVGEEIVFLRRKENAPMHRFETVAHVRQGAAHDHAHRVSEIGTLHLVGDGNRADVGGRRNRSFVSLIGQNRPLWLQKKGPILLGDSRGER